MEMAEIQGTQQIGPRTRDWIKCCVNIMEWKDNGTCRLTLLSLSLHPLNVLYTVVLPMIL